LEDNVLSNDSEEVSTNSEEEEEVEVKSRSSYKAGANVTVDEQLITFRGRSGFKVYIPSKPGKYGMKVWMLCDAETGYCMNLQPYVCENCINLQPYV
jgi:hypothetical protein